MKLKPLLKKAAALLLCSVISISAAVSVKAEETFENAETAVSNITTGWNLGNTLDSCGEWIGLYTQGKPQDYETAWGNPVTTRELITAVKKSGFNAVRVPVTWAEHIGEDGSINEEWLNRVQEVVDYVISQDIYCILNVHHDAGSDGWLEASESCFKISSNRFSGLWKNIAVRFRDYGDRLIFESFNEILDSRNSWNNSQDSGAYKAVNSFNQLFVDTVRATGGNNAKRNLMVQVYSASSSDKTLEAFSLPKDSAEGHLIIQIHNYDPAGFTSSSATWTTMTDTWGSEAEKQYFEQLFDTLKKFSEKQGAPLVIGEFGAEYKGNESSRELYAEYFVSSAAQRGIKCFWWDTGEMALFDRSSASVKYPKIVKALTKYASGKAAIPGDADGNGFVNALDASAILKYVVGITSETDTISADFNGDGKVNAIDAADILKHIVA